eukprot:TRINITY_DN416_c0_g1_i1.p1 TRINITY_DN416_c0_g1~~TRINITY_DN416_c0_g1_i1.p1  ORF type:complete len:4227 (+),score=663.16 TRINITY_DN416_c0_g1_i1:71-12751(+)
MPRARLRAVSVWVHAVFLAAILASEASFLAVADAAAEVTSASRRLPEAPRASHSGRLWRRFKRRMLSQRRLQETTTVSTQTPPGVNTRRSSVCLATGQSVSMSPFLLPQNAPPGLCAYCRQPTHLDPCRYDVSQCRGISQGQFCRIRCKSPYVGASTVANCENTGQVGAEANLSYVLPECTPLLQQERISCPNPAQIPPGYEQVRETGEWVCSKGYYGKASRTCAMQTDGGKCTLLALFEGCPPLSPCREPEPFSDFQGRFEIPACGYDTSGCGRVDQGQSCEISCKYPYLGSPVTAFCPENNADPNTQLVYTPPKCVLHCPDPENRAIPEGIIYVAQNQRFECAKQYSGEVVKNCWTNSECQRRVTLTGCKKLSNCKAPQLDSCRYDWSSCEESEYRPGTVCQIGCKLPFTGFQNQAICPGNNSDPEAPLQYLMPWCSLECPDPLPMPAGYTRVFPGYRCASGYTGLADKSCGLSPVDCSMQVGFSGCQKLVGCKALPPKPAWPARGNRCELDTTECDSPIAMGGSCEVHCKLPFVGPSARGTCPSRNTDPGRELDFKPPNCVVPECPDPIPPGYMKTADGWRCARGYGGAVQSSCTKCGRIVLKGCITAVPCVPLVVEDECLTNITECADGLGVGQTCTITCGNAYVGEPTVASCPADNIDPTREMDWTRPQCTLFCADPDPVPAGYVVEHDWRGQRRVYCAEGYTGTADSNCTLLPGCRTELRLTGCIKLQPCLPLDLPFPERYDASGCQSVPAGGSCKVGCHPPWQGSEAVATCPANNVKLDTPLTTPEDIFLDRHGRFYNALWPPKCTLRCDTIKPGYEKALGGDWRCAKGFIGTVQKTCSINPRCSEAIQLDGCKELLPCTIPGLDACMHDVSDCGGFQRGTGCKVGCRAPYNGTATSVQCQVNNTKTEGGLDGELPECIIEECEDPDPIPPGYSPINAEEGEWTCAPGYTGQAQKICRAVPTVPQNVAKQAMLDQYGLQQPECETQGFLVGCIITAFCTEFVIEDSCMFSAPSCDAKVTQDGKLIIAPLAAGEQCEVKCKTPYRAASSFVMCPATNTDARNPPVWKAPTCELGCPEPSSMEGYKFLEISTTQLFTSTITSTTFPNETEDDDEEEQDHERSGIWMCDDGWTGVAIRNCSLLPGCTSKANYFGCRKMYPCKPFTTKKCGVNFTDCDREVEQGKFCEMTCTVGYTGGPFQAKCPNWNIQKNRPLRVQGGGFFCQRIFEEGYCYDPEPPPRGYTRNSDGAWACTEGFTGTPVEACPVSTKCGEELQLSGCREIVACKVPALDPCWYEAAGCDAVLGGQSCQISCRSPAIGANSTAVCAAGNLDSNQELQYTLPECTIPECADPERTPKGYNKTERVVDIFGRESGGEWLCAERFAGVVEETCIFDEKIVNGSVSCTPVRDLNGCRDLQSCVGPSQLDSCKYSINVCRDGPKEGLPGGNDGYRTVQPGGECEITCRGKFVGAATVGKCPLNNTDPWKTLDYDPPLLCDCPEDEDPWDEGYNQSEEGDWICEPSYGGVAKGECTVLDGCQPKIVFSGCAPLVTCRPLNLTGLCRYDFSDCNRPLDGGESCKVLCKQPAVGEGVNATCPEENTVIDQELMAETVGEDSNEFLTARYAPLVLPECDAPSSCPDPVPLPDGYVRIGLEGGPLATSYACADGWAPSPRLVRECVIFNASDQLPHETKPCGLSARFEGCMPIVNCSGIDDRVVDTCRFKIEEDCPSPIEPGEGCMVSCLQPFYRGNASGTAMCPSDNTDPAAQPIFPQEVVCVPACPEPEIVPDGYEKVGIDWVCSPGWIGEASAVCTVNSIFSSETRKGVCVAEIVLSGCEQLQGCQPPALDSCRYDVDSCMKVDAGQNCTISCRDPPFVGASTNASCPWDNLDPLKVLDFEVPSCELQCPPPEEIPDGYNFSNGSYVCIAGWFGTPKAECLFNQEDCSYGVALSGCGQSSACVGLNLSSAPGQCFFDVWPPACSLEDERFPVPNWGRGAGGSCTVSCRLPCQAREGEADITLTSCPATNINPRLPLQGLLPNCSFDCDPVDPGGGYVKGADGEWRCADLFFGEAVATCRSGDICKDELYLSGCLPLQPCVLPEIREAPCTYQISSCAGISFGESCEVECRAPFYRGEPRPAFCSINNTDPLGQPSIPVLPECNWNPQESCPDPPREPDGYVQNLETGSWSCAPGYAGRAVRSCGLRPQNPRTFWRTKRCIPEAVLTGCARLAPCIEPQTLDCRFNTSMVESLWAGGQGLIYCNVPYDGEPTVAQCPWDNNAEGLEPLYEFPDCQPACPPVPGEAVPLGFLWTERTKTWSCQDGYRGPAEVNCTLSPDCEWKLDFGGCDKIYPCAALNLTDCQVDISNCTGVLEDGETCELRCQPPYFFGESTVASCPKDNIVEGKELEYMLPVCEVTCPDPDPPPTAYVKSSAQFGAWTCAPGYSGMAQKSCHTYTQSRLNENTSEIENFCVTETVLSGCLPIVPCKGPDIRTQPPCFFNTSMCSTVDAGSYCDIHCLPPYTGNVGKGWCKGNNTDPWRPLTWEWPACSLDPCPDPPEPIPAGYVKVPGLSGSEGWKCAEEYAGSPQLSCIADPLTGTVGNYKCSVTTKLVGCFGEVPCAPLPLDACMLDASNCSEGVPVGNSCDVFCKFPYTGTAGAAHCPASNINPLLLPTLDTPTCEVDCSSLHDTVPVGHVWNNVSNVWECQDGYAGEIVVDCFLDFDGSECGKPKLIVSGCFPLSDCLAPVVDLCQFIVSDCQQVARGGSCSISCREPYSGVGTYMYGMINVARGMQAAASSVYEGASLDKLIDGDVAVSYSADAHVQTGYDDPAWLEVDLRQIYKLSHVTVFVTMDVPNGTDSMDIIARGGDGVALFTQAAMTPDSRNQIRVNLPPDTTQEFLVEHSTSWQEEMVEKLKELQLNASAIVYAIDRHEKRLNVVWQDKTPSLDRVPDTDAFPLAFVAEDFIRIRYIRVQTRQQEYLALGEIEAWANLSLCESGDVEELGNVAISASLTASSIFDEVLAPLEKLIDGDTNVSINALTYSRTGFDSPSWIELDFDVTMPLEMVRIVVAETQEKSNQIDVIGKDGLSIPIVRFDRLVIDAENVIRVNFPSNKNNLRFVRVQNRVRDYLYLAEIEVWRTLYRCMSSVAKCDLLNTDPLEGLERKLPQCSHSLCPDPPELPLGYVKVNGTHTCAEGYIGQVVRACSAFAVTGKHTGNDPVGPVCYPEAIFSGCQVEFEIVPCQPPIIDKCLHNTSCSGSNLDPGGTCDVRCKLPYWKGNATSASCPLDNMNKTGGLQYELPQCSLWCPEPTALEEPAYLRYIEGGSSQSSSGWVCSPGYIGTPIVSCELLPPTSPGGCGVGRLKMSGCIRLEPCVSLVSQEVDFKVRLPAPPPVRGEFIEQSGEGFEINTDGCASLGPGQACLVGCREPFVGPVVAAICPAGNTDRFQIPVLDKAPHCKLKCPDPDETPVGYELLPYTRHSLPPLDGAAGGWNTVTGGEWKCTEDYTGSPLKYCNASAACNATAYEERQEQEDLVTLRLLGQDHHGCENEVELDVSLTGCTKLQPCAAPVLDPCIMETSDCPNSGEPGGLMEPGQSCEVHCRLPFLGESTGAHCPANNTVLNGGLVWPMPDCILPECYDPIPVGYMLGSDGWECADGYHGTAIRGCATDANCDPEIFLTGCVELQPCIVPRDIDRCVLNFTACAGAMDGMSCELRCLGPLYRAAEGTQGLGVARCPAGNTDRERELEILIPPECEPVCETPPITDGYDGAIDEGWECAEGYHGTPVDSCTVAEVDGSCRANFTLSGCLPLLPCAPLKVPEFCMYDVAGCMSLDAGGACNITCKVPYRGIEMTQARCPADNVVPNSQPEVTFPACTVRPLCEDPDGGVPEGYVYTGFVDNVACAEGWHGVAKRECVAFPVPGSNVTNGSTGDCYAEGTFTGCEKIVPCLSPPIAPTDCEMEAPNCSDKLPAGGSCEVRCRTPKVGSSTIATCHENNTDPLRVATWEPPVCGCPDPAGTPPGYIKANTWECLAGYVGKAVKSCLCGAENPVLHGCYAPVSCGAAGFTDEDARKGYIGGKIRFGPNVLGEELDEEGVFRYEIYWADDCGEKLPGLGPLAAVQPKTFGGFSVEFGDAGCCKGDVYAVPVLPTAPPEGAVNFLLSVLTRSGPAPDGLVLPLKDFNYEDRSDDDEQAKIRVGSNTRPRSSPQRCLLWALLLAKLAFGTSHFQALH